MSMSAITRPFKWFYHEFGVVSIHDTGRNAYLIIVARACRMFAFGTNALILAIFFSALEYSDHQIGLFMTLTLLGDVFLGTFVALIADKVGRRRVLLGGSFLMILSGLIFAFFENFWILLAAATLGVLSVTGGDFGPFRSIEESVLSQLTTSSTRADVLSWYVAVSTLGSGLGSEASGRLVQILEHRDGWSTVDAYHTLFLIYTAMGVLNVGLVLGLTDACELETSEKAYTQIPQHEHGTVEQRTISDSQIDDKPLTGWTPKTRKWLTSKLVQISKPTRGIMYKLWILLTVDSLADGMVPYSLTNYYMDIKFHPATSTLGDITSISYLFGAIGSTFAGPLARKIGLINTMVFTHVPSSVAVLIFPFPPYLWMAAVLLLLRTALNPLDQAPRAAFIAAVVKPDERTAVMGITSMVRTLASMAGPSLTGVLAASERFWIAFVAAGAFRLAYDFGLWALFVNVKLDRNESEQEDVDHQRRGRRLRRDEEEQEDLELELEMHDLANSDSGFSDASDSDSLLSRRARKKDDMVAIDQQNSSIIENVTDGSPTINIGTSTGNVHLQPLSSDRLRSRSPHPS